MMESQLKCQSNLVDQVKELKTEKEILEKYIFTLIKCLTVDELEKKISDLEKKQKILVLLENLTRQIRAEIEPMHYFKITLETKLLFENNTNQSQPKSFNESNSCDSKLDTDHMNFMKTLLMSKILKLENTQNISAELLKPDLISTQKLCDSLTDIIQMPSSSNSMPVVNDESLNIVTQILGQYDEATNQNVSNSSENHSNAQSDKQELITSDSSTTDNTSEGTDIRGIKQHSKSSSVVNIDCTIKSDYKESMDNFEDMNLKDELLRGIYKYGLEKPSSIQQYIIPPCIERESLVAYVPTGTDKIAALSISILQQIDTSLNKCQALIMAPTIEIIQQIKQMIIALGYFMKASCLVCFGDEKKYDDLQKLNTKSHIVIGTPDCICDMIARKSLLTKFIKTIVIDETNKMISGGFEDQIIQVLKSSKKDTQIILLSATVHKDIMDLFKPFIHRPNDIFVDDKYPTLKNVNQFYIDVVKEEKKLNTLYDLCKAFNKNQSLVFCNTRQKVEWLTKNMRSKTIIVAANHGKISQSNRQTILHEFSSGFSKILITTDMLDRGIDVHPVSLVINYDMPTVKNYIRRVGCFKSDDPKCVAINLISEEDKLAIKEIESFYNIQIMKMPENFADVVISA